jgi:hypothetical protein
VGDRVLDGLPPLGILERLGNPLRSEAAAFRWLLVIAATVVLVTVLVLVLR